MVCDTDPTVRAIRGGKVIRSRHYGDWGQYVVIKQDDGYEAIYAHLSARNVTEGQVVADGDKVGLMGNTGNVSGAHLHLEIQTDYYSPFAHADIAEYRGIVNEAGPVKLL